MTTATLPVLAAAAGLLVSPVIIWLGPRLAAPSLAEPPPMPAPTALIPLAGFRAAHLSPLRTVPLYGVTAGCFAALALHFGPDLRLALALAYSYLLIAIGYIDLQYRLVLNKLSFPGLALALAGSLVWPGLGIAGALLGAAVALVAFGLLELVGRGALGTGDTKLAVLIGAMRGLRGGLDGLALGVILGGLGALFFLVVLRHGRRDKIAYAPYLAAGAILSFFFGGP